MKKILITGATGFVGQNLCRQFASNKEYELYCVVRNTEKAKNVLPKNLRLVDAVKLDLVSSLGIDYVVHLASCLTSRDDTESMRSILDVNIRFSTELLDVLKDCKCLKFINLGSFAEYKSNPGIPEPAYLYTAAKQAFRPILDYYAANGEWSYVHLIPYTIYGGENNQKKLIDYVRESLDAPVPVKMSPGYQVSDFIHINDVIGCIRFLIDNPQKWNGQKGEVYHLGTGRGTSIRELARIFEQATKKKTNIEWGGLPYRKRDIMHAVAPISKLKDLGWQAKIKLENGIVDTLVVGAGISGLGALHTLYRKPIVAKGLEKSDTYGGLCSSFSVNGFRFDRFIHLSFSNIDEVNVLFSEVEGGINRHSPNPSNLYKGRWIKHPSQNNLYVLDDEEKKTIIDDFKKRPDASTVKVKNYEEWLRVQFGDYFAEHFPMVYTRKYWMKEAKDLRTEWVGNRIYQPSIEEVIAGSKSEDTRITYYAKEMRYPKTGGYQHFLSKLAEESNIAYKAEVQHIDTIKREVTTIDGEVYPYRRLISSLPLPEIVKMLDDVPEEVMTAVSKLETTSGYHVSIALKTKNIPPYLWWYIYDEDNIASRVYSPSMKSEGNAPEGCSSLQMEVYCKENEYNEQELLDRTVGKLVNQGIIKQDDILFTHIGFEKYANVIFTEPIYYARKTVRDYLSSVGIDTIGRFGEWDYLWSDQSLVSGLNIKQTC